MDVQTLLDRLAELGHQASEVTVPPPAPPTPALPDLYAILKDYFEDQPQQSPRLRPSSLGIALDSPDSQCALSWWGQMQGLEVREVAPGEAMMFDHGHRLHERMADLLTELLPQYGWFVVAVEQKVRCYSYPGTLDLLIEHARTGYRLVVDFKTKRANAFKYLDKAKEDNVVQVEFYIEAAKADGGMLLYIDREGQNFVKTFYVPPNPARVEDLIAKAEAFLDPKQYPEGPPALGLKIERRINKGPDSVYLKRPWQMDWCKLQDCLCAQLCPNAKRVPEGIVAKIDADGFVTATEGNEEWLETVALLLVDAYPDEKFSVEGDLFK